MLRPERDLKLNIQAADGDLASRLINTRGQISSPLHIRYTIFIGSFFCRISVRISSSDKDLMSSIGCLTDQFLRLGAESHRR